MTYIIDNLSALRHWYKAPNRHGELPTQRLGPILAESSASVKVLKRLDEEGLGFPGRPLHLLVSAQARRNPSKRIICHQRTIPLPPNSLQQLAPGLFIASPELCFLEAASILPFPKLVELGCFLCGTYYLDPQAGMVNGKQQLTTKAKLTLFLESAGGGRGCAQAAQALCFVAEGAASPYEAKLCLLLCLPTKQGGYGFPFPTLNQCIRFAKRDRALFGHDRVVVDLYWEEAKVGIEYDGSAYHSDEGQLTRDRRKDSELSLRGITLLRIDKHQIETASQIHVLARKLARLLGKRLHRPTAAQWRNRRQLHNALIHGAGNSR